MNALLTSFYAVTVCLTSVCADPAKANPWDLISAIEYNETETDTEWKVEKVIPEALRAQAKDFRITGYYVPVEAQGFVTQFLMVADPADCPFCGQNGYGPTLEVHMKRPMPDKAEAAEITIQGQLHFDESTETYRAVYVTNAILIEG